VRRQQKKYYPTILGAIHLVVLYLFVQTVIDFPLALIDYFNDTEYLYHPVKKIILGVGSVVFILYFGYRKAQTSIGELFPVRFFNPLVLIPITLFLWASHNFLNDINIWVDKQIPPPPWFWELFNKIFESDYGIYGAILKVVIIAPVIEELIFRGIIMHGLMRNYPKLVAIFFSGLLFALFHLNPWQFPATFLLGLLLGWIMIRTRNIFACILGHAINNGLVLLAITYADRISEFSFSLMPKYDQLKISGLVAMLSLILIALLTMNRKKKKQPAKN
jgi:membrane protease YdiL (CAAX protease family)